MKNLLNDAANSGVEIFIESGKLKARAKKGSISDELKKRIASNKDELLIYLAQAKQHEVLNDLPPIVALDRSVTCLPASFAQERLWLTDQLSAEKNHYNMHGAFHVSAGFDVNIAEKAFSEIIQRHESLRTSIYYSGTQVMQRIHEATSFRIIKREASAKQVVHLLKEHSGYQFDLGQSTLLDVMLIVSDQTEMVLSICMHHIVSDGWSENLLINEFVQFYNAFKQNKDHSLPALEIQYRDYSHWQRQWISSAACEEQLSYWRKQLAELPSYHSLPVNRTPAKDISTKGAALACKISKEVSEKVSKVANENGVTPFILLHAVFSLLISRHSNNDDIAIGTPVANRSNEKLESLIGFFINTVVLRTKCDETLTFSEYLQSVKRVNLDAQNHQFIPFSYLVEKLNPQRSNKVTPFFQIFLAMDSNEQGVLELMGETISPFPLEEETAKFDLTLYLKESQLGLSAVFNYNCALFSQSYIQKLVDDFERLLSDCLNNNHRSLASMPMLTQAELLAEEAYLKTATKSFDTRPVHELFSAYAQLHPERIAVKDENNCFTYDELNRKSNQLARYLIQQGFGQNSIIGLSSDWSAYTILGMLGILKAGAAYLPMEATYPPERLSYVIEDSGVKFIIATQISSETLHSYANCLALDTPESEALLSAFSADNLPSANEDACRRLLYIIYTSGSTGRPKGVMVEHLGMSHYVHGVSAKHNIEPGLNYAALSTIATDLGNTTIFLSLACGGSLHFPQPETALNPNAVMRFIEQRDIHAIKLTPSHFSALSGNNLEKILKQCKYIFMGGEKIPSQLLNDLQSLAGKHTCNIINHYGPTEITIGFCTHVLNAEDKQFVPIGTPFLNGRFSLRDRYGRRVPKGMQGELYIAGPGLARGYLNKDELTAEKFIVEGSAAGAGGGAGISDTLRFYRTGDWVIETEAGELRFLGRIDDQVKVRGFRIELGEIEQVILKNTPCESAIVRVLRLAEDESSAEIIAYVQCKESNAEVFDENNFIGAVAGVLPPHMVPRRFVRLQAWPLTANGKIDFRALPVPQATEEILLAAQSDYEKKLCAIWGRLLNRDKEKIGKGSNFFNLGGNSLLAIRLVAEIREHMQYDVSIRHVFDNPELANLAKFLEELPKLNQTSPIMATSQAEQDNVLSFGQGLIWFIHLMEQGSTHYNMPSVLDIEGEFHIEYARQSIQMIIERHSILRTVYLNDSGDVVQRARQNVTFDLPEIDLSELSGSKMQEQLKLHVEADMMAPFDLQNGLPIRLKFIRLARNKGKLLFNMHHIASDGWSARLLMEEFSENYQQLLENSLRPKKPLPFQYADYAIWQQTQLRNGQFDQQLAYWERTLENLPDVHSLPLDAPRPAHRTYNGAGVSVILEQEVVEGLKKIARQHSATLFMVLHAAFAMLLARHANASDVVLGTPVANRMHTSLESLIGFFVNTLVLRTTIHANMTFKDLLTHVREVNLAAQANQDVAFEQVVERVNPQRSVKYSPLFQIMLTLDETVSKPLEIAGMRITPEFQEESVSKFELTVDATALQEGYFFNFQYNTDIFSRNRISGLAADFMRLLRNIAQNPGAQLRNIQHFDAQELQKLMPTESAIQSSQDASHFDVQFAKAARIHSDKVALQWDAQCISYRELERRANQLAHYLWQCGVRQGDVVGLLMSRSFDLIVSVLATMRAGATYMTIDSSAPGPRIIGQLQHSQAKFCLAHQAQYKELDFTGADLAVEVILLDSPEVQADVAACEDIAFSVSRIDAIDATAYVMYTSGSTGKPKGVSVSHANLMAYARAALGRYTPQSSDKVLQFSSISFDIFIEEMAISLLSGACLVIRDEYMLAGGEYFWKKIHTYGITIMSLPTAFWHQLSRDLDANAVENMQCLRLIILGGERLSVDAVLHWHKMAGDKVEIINTYGPTETTVAASTHVLAWDNKEYLSSSIPIGGALSHCRLLILAPDQSLAPVGAVGELYIGGPGVAQGYLHNPQQTAASFLDDIVPNCGRLYRTGDWVRFKLRQENQLSDSTPELELEFIGRVDNQVKIRGYRVEPGEVEYQLSKLDELENAFVVVHHTSTKQTILVAYIVFANKDDDAAVSGSLDDKIESLRFQLAKNLPDYMIPSVFIPVERLPLTANGKVDRKALPQPDNFGAQENYLAPRNEIERRLCEICQELLGLERVGVRDNFFHIGGHSLTATRLLSQIRQSFNVTLSLKTVFELQVLERIAKAVMQLDVVAHQAAITRVSRDQALPLSFAQHRLWLLDQVEEGSAHYNMSTAVKLNGNLNLAALHFSLTRIIERHESLRTYFVLGEDGVPAQRIHDAGPFNLELIDLSLLEEGARQLQVQKIAAQETGHVFNLKQDLMIRGVLVKCTADEHILLLTMHHIASDGWSVPILVKEFAALYQANVLQLADPLQPHSIQYADYAYWQRHWLQTEVLNSQLQYWTRQLANLPTLHNLPLDFSHPAIQSFAGDIYSTSVEGALATKFEALCQLNGATIFMGLHAALALLISRYSNELDVVIGSPIANREQAEIADLIGFFVNTLVLRSDLSGSPSFIELLSRSKNMLLDAYAHQQVPFEQLVESLRPERSLSYSPLFQIMLVLHNNESVESLELPELRISPFAHMGGVVAKYDLSLNVTRNAHGLHFEWEYNTDLFKRETIVRVASNFSVLFDSLVSNPETCVFELNMLTETERRRLLPCLAEADADFAVVMNPYQGLAALGVVGELHVTDVAYARKHFKRPELAADDFIINPFAETAASKQRLYKTGELVKLSSDGGLEFVGRADQQVKIRGMNIDLGQIEAVLRRHENIRDAAVSAFDTEAGERRLLAYIVTNAHSEIGGSGTGEQQELVAENLHEFLRNKLSDFMLPSEFVFLPALPLKANGKLNRDALPKLDFAISGDKYVAPEGEIEVGLAQLWARLLECPLNTIGADHSFFALGGHSILVIRLVINIDQKFGVKLTARDVFLSPKLSSLAEKIKQGSLKRTALLSRLHDQFDTSRVTVFCIPGALGTAASFMALAQNTQAFNVCAFDHRGVFGNEAADASIEHMASSMIEEIKQEQGTGPYFIAGHSMGAQVAFEIVSRFEQVGEIAYLIALDGSLHTNTGELAEADDLDQSVADEEAQKVIHEIQSFLKMGASGELISERLQLVYKHHARLSRDYRVARPLKGEILSIVAQESKTMVSINSESSLSESGVCEKVAGGGHYSMLTEPHVHDVVQFMGKFIERQAECLKNQSSESLALP